MPRPGKLRGIGPGKGKKHKLTGNVLQVSTVLQPRSTSRDVIRRALALHLDQHRQVLGLLAIPRLEGLQELETVRLGVDGDVDAGRRRVSKCKSGKA